MRLALLLCGGCVVVVVRNLQRLAADAHDVKRNLVARAVNLDLAESAKACTPSLERLAIRAERRAILAKGNEHGISHVPVASLYGDDLCGERHRGARQEVLQGPCQRLSPRNCSKCHPADRHESIAQTA